MASSLSASAVTTLKQKSSPGLPNHPTGQDVADLNMFSIEQFGSPEMLKKRPSSKLRILLMNAAKQDDLIVGSAFNVEIIFDLQKVVSSFCTYFAEK